MANSGGSSVVKSFGDGFVRSHGFDSLYGDINSLVTEAAHYLNLDARIEAKEMSDDLRFRWSCEVMRLTTKLMQLSQWAMSASNLRNGMDIEILPLNLVNSGETQEILDQLPSRLVEYINRAKVLYKQAKAIDQSLRVI